jgi:DNA-binding transcriptional MerR regulator
MRAKQMRSPGQAVPPQDKPDIPEKLYFRIGEVAQIAAVEPYVLRFWETEFPTLAPKKTGSGHRLYRRKDVEMILELKRLLYEKRFTIEGARLWLEQNKKKATARPIQPVTQPQSSLFAGGETAGAIAEIRRGLAEILKILK